MVEIGHSVAYVCHHCNIFYKEAVVSGCNDPEMGPANSLHALALYSEYNKKFDSRKFATKNKLIVCFCN